MSFFFYLALIRHSINIYAKIAQRVACLMHFQSENREFSPKIEIWAFRPSLSRIIKKTLRCGLARKQASQDS
jgi:hypothetical protein